MRRGSGERLKLGRGPRKSRPRAHGSRPPTRRSPYSTRRSTMRRSGAHRRRRHAEARRRRRDRHAGTPLVVITDLDNAWANLFVPTSRWCRAEAGAGGEGLHRRRRPGSSRQGHVHLARRPSSPRATCRPRKSDRSSSTASRSAWTTVLASSSRACPSMRRFRLPDDARSRSMASPSATADVRALADLASTCAAARCSA